MCGWEELRCSTLVEVDSWIGEEKHSKVSGQRLPSIAPPETCYEEALTNDTSSGVWEYPPMKVALSMRAHADYPDISVTTTAPWASDGKVNTTCISNSIQQSIPSAVQL